MSMESLGTILRRIAARETWTTTENGTDGYLGRSTTPGTSENCDVCEGVGWLTLKAPLGHSDFGQVFPCQCQDSRIDKKTRIGALERYSNLGPLRRCTFASSRPEQFIDSATERAVFDRASEAAEDYANEPHGWISFTGPSGSGKTWLAAAIAKRQLELERAALFITASALLDYLRGGFDTDVEDSFIDLYEQVKGAHLLILDDLPTRPSSPWGHDRLLQLLAYRHASRLPTVVTLRGDFGHLDEFLRARLETADGFARTFVLRRTDNGRSRGFGSIPTGMRNRMTIGAFDPAARGGLSKDEFDSLTYAYKSMELWARYPMEWKLLTGPVGVGKTHLAVAAALLREERGDAVFFTTVSDLLDRLRSAYAPDSPALPEDLLEQVKTVDLLVLDDFGAERSTPFAEEKLFQIINYRYEERLPTAITTSLEFREIESSRPRLASRLEDREVVMRIPMSGPDYRRGRKP